MNYSTSHSSKPRKALVFGAFVLCLSFLFAQPRKSLVEVIVNPEQIDWTYESGERADFEVKVLKNGQALSGISASYKIGPEQMPPLKTGELELKDGKARIKGIVYDKPGFVRCAVSVEYQGRTYRGWGTAGHAPDQIEPIVDMPNDFEQFWTQAKAELANVPIDAKLTLMPAYCTGEINVYHLSLQNILQTSWWGNSRFYGMLSVPKKPGRYPAILGVPGAGVRPYYRDDRAAEGVIVLKIGIHGIPVNMDPSVYQDLGKGALSGYQINKLDDQDQYYFKRVYLGCVRAIDYIYSMPEFDGENLAVTGGSQGGALSIITAGLDKRVKYLAAFFPALCDLTAYLEGQAGGWPHMFKDYDPAIQPNWMQVAPYYDVVNFARQLQVPGWYSWGFNDNVCPPTSMYAAYNVIDAPKELHLFHETGHWTFPEQGEEANAWLMEKLKP